MKKHKNISAGTPLRRRSHASLMLKKHKKLFLSLLILAILLAAAFFLIRWSHNRFLQQMYPRTYAEIVVKESKDCSLDQNFVYAVIRQESNFNADAESRAGAIGLMQLTPDTFDWLQYTEKTSEKERLSKNALYQPEINIRYGCRFLSILMKKYGNRRTALCAYNAGQGRVDSWLKNKSVSKDGKNLDNIPFPETKNYAKRVEDNYQQYKELYASD